MEKTESPGIGSMYVEGAGCWGLLRMHAEAGGGAAADGGEEAGGSWGALVASFGTGAEGLSGRARFGRRTGKFSREPRRFIAWDLPGGRAGTLPELDPPCPGDFAFGVGASGASCWARVDIADAPMSGMPSLSFLEPALGGATRDAPMALAALGRLRKQAFLSSYGPRSASGGGRGRQLMDCRRNVLLVHLRGHHTLSFTGYCVRLQGGELHSRAGSCPKIWG